MSISIDKCVASLTPRERQVLEALARGMTSELIAISLGLSSKTIANHRAAVKRKLGAANNAELTRIAIATGVLSNDVTDLSTLLTKRRES